MSASGELREMRRALESLCDQYERHAAECSVCGRRDGSFCHDGSVLLSRGDRAARDMAREMQALSEEASALRDVADRHRWNAQL